MKPGIYTVEEAKYHRDDLCDVPSLSSGIAHLLCSSTPLHAWTEHPRLNPDYKPTEAEHFDIGTAAHAILLEGVNVVEVVQGFDDWRKKEARERRDEIRSRGKVPLLAKVWADVEAMVNAARDQLDRHIDGKHMFLNGKPEQVLVWQDIGGVWCRARLDWMRPATVSPIKGAFIDDYKSTSASANPYALTRTLYDKGWDVQEAFYRRGLKILTGWDAQFRFACQETYPPYALSVIGLGPAGQTIGEKKVLFALETWRHCMNTGQWPAYPNDTCWATLPEYIENAWLRKEEAEVSHAG